MATDDRRIDRVAMQAVVASLGYVPAMRSEELTERENEEAAERALVVAHAIVEMLEALAPYPAPSGRATVDVIPNQLMPVEREFIRAVEEKRL